MTLERVCETIFSILYSLGKNGMLLDITLMCIPGKFDLIGGRYVFFERRNKEFCERLISER